MSAPMTDPKTWASRGRYQASAAGHSAASWAVAQKILRSFGLRDTCPPRALSHRKFSVTVVGRDDGQDRGERIVEWINGKWKVSKTP